MTSMDRTDSEINLLKGQLYLIVGSDSLEDFDPSTASAAVTVDSAYDDPHLPRLLRLKNEMEESLDSESDGGGDGVDGGALLRHSTLPQSLSGGVSTYVGPPHKPLLPSLVVDHLLVLAALGVLGNGMLLLAAHLHDNNVLDISIASRPLQSSEWLASVLWTYAAPLLAAAGFESALLPEAPLWVARAFTGVALGVARPLADRWVFRKPAHGNNLQTTLRAVVAVAGIVYAIRRVEWTSLLHVLLLWLGLNMALWGYLDASAAGFVVSSATAAVVMAMRIADPTVPLPEHWLRDAVAVYLWLGSFYFCSSIIFGKVGRLFYA